MEGGSAPNKTSAQASCPSDKDVCAKGIFNNVKGKLKNGCWTDSEDNSITKALLGETVRFHITTENAQDGDEVFLTIYDKDLISDDKISETKVIISGNKGYVDIKLEESWIKFIEDDNGVEIELYCECEYNKIKKDFPVKEKDYLLVYEKGETVTVLIELPHPDSMGKLNAKGLAGHTGIIIGDDYFDFGPGEQIPRGLKAAFAKPDGRPWWDISDLGKQDILHILNNDYPADESDKRNRLSYRITGEVNLLDICIQKNEFRKLKEWWVNRDKNPGKYSVNPALGEQCTTAVRISLEESTSIFKFYNITSTTQTPGGLLNLLTTKAKHTAGKRVYQLVTVSEVYPQLPLMSRTR